jgi:vanillate/3-O-methylgallate O-demethylase
VDPRHAPADFSVAGFRRPLQLHHGSYWGPPQFTNWVDESLSWKNSCYIGDWSFLPAIRYKGPEVLKLFSDISVNTLANFAVGQSKHVIHCNAEGKIIEEGILSRYAEDEFVAFSTFWAEHYGRKHNYKVEAEFLKLAIFHVQGPNSLYLLERLAREKLRDIKFMRFRKITIAGHEVTALRQGMTGELGFELQLPAEHGREVWDEVVRVGREFGIRELSGRVAMLNHLEACYPTHTLDYMPAIFGPAEAEYLQELVSNAGDHLNFYFRISGSYESNNIADWYRSPVEFGWGNRINFDHAFIGDTALRRELAAPKRKIATLVWNSEDVVNLYADFFRKDNGALPDFMEMPQDPRGYMCSDKVVKDGKLVGVTSSRGYSTYFREMISLCVIDFAHHAPGTEVEVVWGNPGTQQRSIRATVRQVPYKPDRARVDLSSLAPELWSVATS